MKKIGRNDLCPCGSGKKYKQCCLLSEETTSAKTTPVNNSAPDNPTPEEINALVALFTDERYTEAATLAQAMTVSFPLYGFGWKALGAVYVRMGRSAAALAPMQKAVTLLPDDAETYNNLGNTLKNLSQLDDAIACYQKALMLNPNYAEARSCLERALKEQEFITAVKSYRDDLPFKPSLAEAHNNLGITFQDNKLVVPLQPTINYAFYPRVPAISLELTNHCNLKCPYCANATLTRPKNYIEWALIEKIVDECAAKQYNLAWLHGVGEPLLWDRLEDVITLIKRKGAGAGSFGTNGTLLRPDRVKRLLDAGLDSIYVSIDTLDPEIYKNTRGGKLEKVIHNIEEMIKIVPNSFQITVALMNHKDYHITDETINQFHQIFGYQDNVRTNLVENQLFPSAPGDYRLDSSRKTQYCWSPVNYLFVALDGRAAICCMDQDVLYSLGNVAEQSISDIWFDQKNQTTFRNIALGVNSCPDSCTQKCILLPPRQNINTASIGLGLSFEAAAQFANVLLQNDGKIIATSILQEMISRDPTNHSFQEILKKLQFHS